MQDADECLARREAGGDFGTQSLGLDRLDERLDYRQGNVGLEQCDAHLAHGLPDVVLGDPAPSTKGLDGPG
jgi:hypothetical protein